MKLDIDQTKPHLAGFQDYYEKEILPTMTAKESNRKATLKKAYIYTSIVIVSIFASIAVITKFGLPDWVMSDEAGSCNQLLDWLAIALESLFKILPEWAGDWDASYLARSCWLMIALIFIWLGIMVVGWLDAMKFKQGTKLFLMEKVGRFLNFTYSESVGSFPVDLFDDILPSFDESSYEDRISGTHDDVEFELIEASLVNKTTNRDSDGTETTERENVFGGLLLHFTFPKNFSGSTRILRDEKNLFAKVLGGIFNEKSRVKLEDPRFEKMFDVYSTDQVESRYLLTPTFMERVVELGKLGVKPPELAFTDNKLLIAVVKHGDQFEGGGIFTSLLDTQRIELLLQEIGIIFEIIDTLKLNLKTVA